MNNALNIEQIFKNFCDIKLVYNDKEFNKNKIISLISIEVIEIINKNITKNNYKAYGLKINDIGNNKNPFFKLDEVRLFMIMIYQNYIRSHKKLNYSYLINQFSSPVLELFNIEFLLFKQFCTSLALSNFKEIFFEEKTNQFIKNIKILKLILSIEKLQNFSNEKIFTFLAFYFLDRFLIILNESGGKELINDFFNLDEERIGCFFKIPNICQILREIKKAGSIYLLKEFINLDNEKLEIFQKDFFLDFLKILESKNLIGTFILILKNNDLDFIKNNFVNLNYGIAFTENYSNKRKYGLDFQNLEDLEVIKRLRLD